VGLGNRQVDDHVDGRIGQHRIDVLGWHAELFTARGGRSHVDVGAGDDLEVLVERDEAEIGFGDVSAADDANAVFFCHGHNP
jgi:hypothetical protein